MLSIKLPRLPAIAVCAAFLALPAVADTAPDAPAIAESYKLPISAPRDQGESDLCWAFAALSMIETNYLVKHPGAEVAFSRGALQRESIGDRFRALLAGKSQHLEDGGLAVDALALIRAEGLVAAADYHDYVDSTPIFPEVGRRLAAAGDKPKALDAALADTLGDLPAETTLDGRKTTPLQAAKAVLGAETWSEYDVLRQGGTPHDGPSDDPDARPGTRVHFVTLATALDLIHRSLARSEAVVWGSTDNHALLIFGADYDAGRHAVAYWVKDSFAPYVTRMPASELEAELTDVTVSDAQQTAARN